MAIRTGQMVLLVLGLAFAAGCGSDAPQALSPATAESFTEARQAALAALDLKALIDLAERGDYDSAEIVLQLAACKDATAKGIDGRALASRFVKQARRRNGTEDVLFVARQQFTGRWIERDIQSALDSYERIAESDSPQAVDAHVMLGMIYWVGRDVRPDKAKAFRHSLAAAEAGDADAQFMTGVYFEEGIGTNTDLLAASRWYESAAKQGSPEAQHNLAMLYLKGRGVAKSPFRAKIWFERAVKQHYLPSVHRLGSMLLRGYGVRKDYDKGVKLLDIAVDANYAPAAVDLAEYFKDDSSPFDACYYYRRAAESGGGPYPKLMFAAYLHSFCGDYKKPHSFKKGNIYRIATGLDSTDAFLDMACALATEVSKSDDRALAKDAKRILRDNSRMKAGALQARIAELSDFEKTIFLYLVTRHYVHRMADAIADTIPPSLLEHLAGGPPTASEMETQAYLEQMRSNAEIQRNLDDFLFNMDCAALPPMF